MKTLLSLPPHVVKSFHQLTGTSPDSFFCTCDPAGRKLGSGGGTAWLLCQCRQAEGDSQGGFAAWLGKEKRILIHAGGQSRRLPAYAPSGKVLTPMPVFDWERGQSLSQNLLSLQLPLYEKLMKAAPASLHTLIASGDVFIRSEASLPAIPDADVVCLGIWAPASQATRHGVYVMDRNHPEALDFMLQKPSTETLESLASTHFYLMDIGLWLLSDKAVNLLMRRSEREEKAVYYDLYADFGRALGRHPSVPDKELEDLSVAIVPLTGGEFYHFGTSAELLTSILAIQQLEHDQRKILHRRVRPNPAITVQNAVTEIEFQHRHEHVWIENSHVSKNWQLGARQIITGVPRNEWRLALPDEVCLDIVPVEEQAFAVRPYGFYDAFRGSLAEAAYLNAPLEDWLRQRDIKGSDIVESEDDIQQMKLFPVTADMAEMLLLIRWMTTEPDLADGRALWFGLPRLSADELSQKANLDRLFEQRRQFQEASLLTLADRYEKSIFYQLDLKEVAGLFHHYALPVPSVLPEKASHDLQIHNRMLRSRIFQLAGKTEEAQSESARAFASLRESMLHSVLEEKVEPRLSVAADQIVWGRCPVRIDVAGGWTDTPPYSLYEGGSVVNMAVELNGQPPLQVYVKSCKEPHIVLRSIDMGAMEVVETYEQLQDYCKIGSPFSIPKAALVLAGFSPLLRKHGFTSLREELAHFGSGVEVTLLAAIPAGSGLGTSSILASTVLGALNDFCGLGWDKNQICGRTLILEQLLTTGGGWQDQYGGVLQGVKLLQTQAGFTQNPSVSWLPEMIFTQPEYRACHLLYYTGLTRTAKSILAEIVQNMFLNAGPELRLLAEMKHHAQSMADAIQCGDFELYGRLVSATWEQNKRLDAGTNPPQVEEIISLIQDYTYGLKLPGAGGGGYLYMVAKDPEAAGRIRKILTEQAPNGCARFVEMSLSSTGFQVTRS